jgi:hypothetical protein
MNRTKFTAKDGEKSSVNENNSANSHADKPISIGVEHGKLVFDNILGLVDHCQTISTQIDAMLVATYGEGDLFEHMDADARRNYLWHIAQLHRQMDAAFNLIAEKVMA